MSAKETKMLSLIDKQIAEFNQHIEYLEITGKKYIKQDDVQSVEQREVEPHKIDPKKCDFYMVTVTGHFGTKVRHDRYENAIKEATRLAKQENHKVWVTGVVAIVEPIQQEVQVKIIEK